jgi:hypothetical protein
VDRLSGSYIIGCYAVAERREAEMLTNKLIAMGLEASYLYIPDYEPGGETPLPSLCWALSAARLTQKMS